MKKKYRKAIYFAIIILMMPILLPFFLMALIGRIAGWIYDNVLIPMCEYLKFNLDIYDY